MEPLELIQIVKQYPYLYDRRIKCSLGQKAKKWNEIGEKYDLTGGQVQTRWRTIKDRYILFKQKGNTSLGTSPGEQAQDYKYAEFLSFLDYTLPGFQHLTPKNSNHPYYQHSHQRMACYKKICNVIKRYKPEVTPQMISRKIRTVRTQFAKEKREHRNKKVKFPFIPKLWFYNRMTFLDEKRVYDPNNVNTFGTVQPSEDIESYNFEQKFEEEDDDVEYVDRDVDDDDDEEEINNVDEWISPKNTTRPFEEVHIKQLDHDYANDNERDHFEGEIEEVFVQEGHKGGHNQTRNDLYVKCTGLLDSLVKQIKPFERDCNTKRMNCNCKSSPPSTLLGKMIETELSKVSENIYVDAKWKIIRILEEAQMKSLREK